MILIIMKNVYPSTMDEDFNYDADFEYDEYETENFERWFYGKCQLDDVDEILKEVERLEEIRWSIDDR